MIEENSQNFDTAVHWLQQAVQKAVDISNPWVEILAIRILIHILNLQGQTVDELIKRLRTLIHTMDGKIRKTPLSERWQGYKREIFNV